MKIISYHTASLPLFFEGMSPKSIQLSMLTLSRNLLLKSRGSHNEVYAGSESLGDRETTGDGGKLTGDCGG